VAGQLEHLICLHGALTSSSSSCSFSCFTKTNAGCAELIVAGHRDEVGAGAHCDNTVRVDCGMLHHYVPSCR
jgi:hypothetical protein